MSCSYSKPVLGFAVLICTVAAWHAPDDDCLIQKSDVSLLSATLVNDNVQDTQAEEHDAVHHEVQVAPRVDSLLEDGSTPTVQRAVEAPDAPHGPWRDWAEMHRVFIFGLFSALGLSIMIYAMRQVQIYEASATVFSPPWHSDIGTLVRVVVSVLACWVLAGVASFTLFMRFTSSARHLTVCEAFYLCMQILTTVGYGDFTPTTSTGMVYMTVYLMVGVCVVAALVGELLAWFMQQQEQKLKLDRIIKFGKPNLMKGVKGMSWPRKGGVPSQGNEQLQRPLGSTAEGDMASADEPEETPENPAVSDDGLDSPAKVNTCFDRCQEPLVTTDWGRLMVYYFLPQLVLSTVGIAFFHLWPGEKKSLWEAFYMCSVTMTTVGFGMYHPVTQVGYAFSSIWMLLSVWFMGRLITGVAEVVFKHHRKASTAALARGLLESLQSSGKETVTQEEFLRLELIRCGYVRAQDIDSILGRFKALDSNSDGVVDLDDLHTWGPSRVTQIHQERQKNNL